MINVKDKTVTILGAARSGIAAAKLLKQKQARVFVSDLAAKDQKSLEIQTLEDEKIDFEFGQHSKIILDADFAVLSPGIPRHLPVVQNLISKKIPVYSEIEIASWFCVSPIIAITGSNGKTTTTTLIGEMLRAETPQSIVAGNIGSALSDFVLTSDENIWATVEVSSFQLETIDTFHPRVAIILNLAPNHLDWYDSFEDYVEAKLLILKNLQEEDYLIYNADDELLSEKVNHCPANKMTFSLQNKDASIFLDGGKLISDDKNLIGTNEIKLNGNHNYQNAMAAILAAKIAGIKDESISKVLKEFKGVEHRLEYVGEIEGITFMNDSKATTIESLAVALTSFETPIILIAGGKDKGSDYSKLNNLIAENVRQVILIGTAKDKMSKAWKDIVPVHLSDTLGDAVEAAFKMAVTGETVLLSPACSSFDMFNDFEDRGKQFKETVYKLKFKYEN
jgi:UDP-N-acetylmuramoylalanine--D-glutamate ligase